MVQYLNDFHTGASLLAALALGGMASFSFVIAPMLFKQLGAETAAAFMSRAFPVYHKLTAVLTAVAGLLVYYRGAALALWGVSALALVSWRVVLPAAERLRHGRAKGDPVATRRFRQLHGLSVAINLTQIGVLAGVVLVLAS